MFSAFKTLFGTPKAKTTPSETGRVEPATVENYPKWRAANPNDAEMIAAERPRARSLRCHVHDTDLVTSMGYRSRMDCLPSGSFMDAAAENPFCLDVGDGLRPLATSNPTRLIYCEACEAGMRAR